MQKDYVFEEKTILDTLVASIRYNGCYDEMGPYISELFRVIKGNAIGPVTTLYYDNCFKEEAADIEICVAVKKPMTGKDVAALNLEGGKFITTVHVGPYETLCEAYEAMGNYIKEKGLAVELPSREVYVKGPGVFLKGNPQKYETEIMYRIKD